MINQVAEFVSGQNEEQAPISSSDIFSNKFPILHLGLTDWQERHVPSATLTLILDHQP